MTLPAAGLVSHAHELLLCIDCWQCGAAQAANLQVCQVVNTIMNTPLRSCPRTARVVPAAERGHRIQRAQGIGQGEIVCVCVCECVEVLCA